MLYAPLNQKVHFNVEYPVTEFLVNERVNIIITARDEEGELIEDHHVFFFLEVFRKREIEENREKRSEGKGGSRIKRWNEKFMLIIFFSKQGDLDGYLTGPLQNVLKLPAEKGAKKGFVLFFFSFLLFRVLVSEHPLQIFFDQVSY